LGVVLSQGSILGFELATALFPAKEGHGSGRATEDLAKLWAQGIHPDRLDGQRLLMETIVATPPATFSDTSPVGGSITSAREAILLDEGFRQGQVLLIDLLPGGARSPRAESETDRY
jgi:hypothetical protein